MNFTMTGNFDKHEPKFSQGVRLVVCQILRPNLIRHCQSLFHKKSRIAHQQLIRTAQLQLKTDSVYILRYQSFSLPPPLCFPSPLSLYMTTTSNTVITTAFFSLANETIALDYQRLFGKRARATPTSLITHGRTLGTRLEKTKEIEFMTSPYIQIIRILRELITFIFTSFAIVIIPALLLTKL